MGQSAKSPGLKVSCLMSPHVIFVSEEDSVAFTLKIFSRCNISGAPVQNNEGQYVGVVSKTDLFDKKVMEYLEHNGNLEELRVGDIMNPTPPLSVDEETPVEQAAEIMLKHHVHRIFITVKGKITGVVSSYDILKIVANVEDYHTSASENLHEHHLLNLLSKFQKKSVKSY